MILCIVIPCFNQPEHLLRCIQSLPSLQYETQIVVIDDGSSVPIIIDDESIKVIRLPKNMGPSYARNIGIESFEADMYACIDCDVTIGSISFSNAINYILSGKCDIVTGTPTAVVGSNFFERYKNTYLEFQFSQHFGNVRFLYGSFCLFRESVSWPEQIRRCEDNYLGANLSVTRKILLSPEVMISHFKHYTLLSLLKNDFIIPFHLAGLINESHFSKKGFSNSNFLQLVSISLAGIVILSSFISFLMAFAFFTLWVGSNYRYFRYIQKKIGLDVLLAIPFTFLDQLVLGSGIFFGITARSLGLLPCK